MPRGPLPDYRRRKEPICDDQLRASVSQVDGIPDQETGRYATILWTGIASRERANEIKRGLFRSRKYVGVSVSATVKPAKDGTFTVEFFAVDPVFAKKYMLETYGNVNHFPYDPRRKSK